MCKKYFDRVLFGGDYNPGQWPEEVWSEDIRIFKLAEINSATINVFSWARLQPSEHVYDFDELDKVIEMLTAENYEIVLATSTAALPAWMFKKYPEVGRTDFEGRQHKFGQRHNACPNSLVYQKYASKLAGKLAERYGQHPKVKCWHINNEYGGECFCGNCEKAFQVWLKDKYQTIDKLNDAWNLEFWGHTVFNWDEIVVPSILSEGINYRDTAFAGISIDYRRFNSDSILHSFIMEREAIRAYDKETPVTTNLMGTYKYLDYFKWAKEMDIVSWDNYPSYDTPASFTAMNHDLMRGLKDGQSFMLMEQTPSQQNWQPYNSLKKPGQMRLQSYQAMAHGADTIQFFQLRRSKGACEKFHGAVIEHVGHENTRVFKEVQALGRELANFDYDIIGATSNNKVAIIFDWDNYWALEYTSGPNKDLMYVEQIHQYYQFFYKNNVPVDIISTKTKLDKYDLVVAPVLYMLKDNLGDRLTQYVEAGGNLVTTFMSGIVDDTDNVILGGYPGPLREVAGIWVEEIDALAPEQINEDTFVDGSRYTCNLLCDIIHLESAEALATYQSDFYSGTPVITKNQYGKGKAWYVGSQLEEQALDKLLKQVISELHIESLGQQGLEITKRETKDKEFYFIMNHSETVHTLDNKFYGFSNILRSNKLIEKDESIKPNEVLVIVNSIQK